MASEWAKQKTQEIALNSPTVVEVLREIAQALDEARAEGFTAGQERMREMAGDFLATHVYCGEKHPLTVSIRAMKIEAE